MQTFSSTEAVPAFTKDAAHQAATYRIDIPYSTFTKGTNAIKMSIVK